MNSVHFYWEQREISLLNLIITLLYWIYTAKTDLFSCIWLSTRAILYSPFFCSFFSHSHSPQIATSGCMQSDSHFVHDTHILQLHTNTYTLHSEHKQFIFTIYLLIFHLSLSLLHIHILQCVFIHFLSFHARTSFGVCRCMRFISKIVWGVRCV